MTLKYRVYINDDEEIAAFKWLDSAVEFSRKYPACWICEMNEERIVNEQQAPKSKRQILIDSGIVKDD